MSATSPPSPESSSKVPQVPALMGYGGLIPFLGCGLASWNETFATIALQGLVAYGAVILSFVGAVQWGLALVGGESGCRDKLFIYSISPALLAWVALLLEATLALPLLMAGFIAARLVELKACGAAVPAWYPRLRTHLTAGALISLMIGWLAVL